MKPSLHCCFFLIILLFSSACGENAVNQRTDAESSSVEGTTENANRNVDPNADFVFSNYYDIAAGSAPGTYVVGTIQMKANRNVGDGTGSVSDLNDYTFVMTGRGNGDYNLVNVRDQGKLYAEFKVADGKTADESTDLTVELRLQGDTVQIIPVTIEVLPKSLWRIYFERALEYAENQGKLRGGEKYKYDDAKLQAILTDIENHNGQLTSLSDKGENYSYIYNGPAALRSDEKNKNGKAFIDIAERIGSLGYPSYHLDPDDPEYATKKERLSNAIMNGFNAFAEVFPLEEFDRNDKLSYGDATHQWKFVNPFGLSLLISFEDIYTKYRAANPDAERFFRNVYRFYQSLFSLPVVYRGEHEMLYSRYYFKKDFTKSPGALADANREHRHHSWIVLAGLIRDYNRPITDKKWWYKEDHHPFLERYGSDVGIQEKWKPSGSFNDLQFWFDSNANFVKAFGQSGFSPDGSVSHHTDVRQDLALQAYGYNWMAEGIAAKAHLFKDLPWEYSIDLYNQTSLFLIKSIKPVIYKGSTDFQAAGRGFLSSKLNGFGRYVSLDLEKIFKSKPDQKIAYEDELLEFYKKLTDGTYEFSGNFAYWNTNFLVHRRGENGEAPWYASFKGQSIRAMGAESFSEQPGTHNGSGVLQVKVDGDEYDLSRMDWDWHLLPGLTEEWRTDKMPMQSQDHEHGLSQENLVGVLSDGRNGLAAMRYASKASYASAKADKFAFFSDFGVYATGDSISRDVKTKAENGDYASDPNTKAPIVTTVDQALWNTDIEYDLGSGPQRISALSPGFDLSADISAPVWFHQGKKGYILWPDKTGTALIQFLGGNAVADTYQKESSAKFTQDRQPVKVFALLFNHGTDPDPSSDGYRYIILPNVSAGEMPEKLNQFKDQANFERIAENGIYGAVWKTGGNQMIQLAFFEAGSVNLLDGKKIRVDKPALVQLTRQSNAAEWGIAVTDPTAFVEGGFEPLDYGKVFFHSALKEGENKIRVDLNWELTPGNYTYKSQRVEERYFTGQDVAVSRIYEEDFVSRIEVKLPDTNDSEAYDLAEAMYSGMTAAFQVKQP